MSTDQDIQDQAEKNVAAEINNSDKSYTDEDVRRLIDEEVAGLKAKNEELLREKAGAVTRAEELEEQQKRQEEERLKEKEQFRELYEREQEAKRELQEKFEDFQGRIQRQAVDAEAAKIAAELTRDNARGELLQEKAAQTAKFTDDGVVFEIGGVPVEKEKVLSHLREKYPFLVDGTGATGGGAAGANSGRAVSSKSFAEMSGAELAELRADNPTEYQRLRNEYYGQ